jgi:hypothetical protein
MQTFSLSALLQRRMRQQLRMWTERLWLCI